MQSQYDTRFTNLRNRFVARSAKDATRLDALLGQMSGDASDEAIREIEQIAHSLSGSAGTFGFPVLGSLADAVEQEIGRLRAAESRDFAKLAAACRRLSEGLRELGRRG